MNDPHLKIYDPYPKRMARASYHARPCPRSDQFLRQLMPSQPSGPDRFPDWSLYRHPRMLGSGVKLCACERLDGFDGAFAHRRCKRLHQILGGTPLASEHFSVHARRRADAPGTEQFGHGLVGVSAVGPRSAERPELAVTRRTAAFFGSGALNLSGA